MPEQRVTAVQRRAVFTRAKGCCEYCHSQARFATQPFAAEHVIPRYAGGKTTLNNLALAAVQTLHLNRPELVNLRRVLYAVGEHTPQV